MELKQGFDSNYRFILVAARRARQLQSGAKPLIDTASKKACRVAEQEVKADKVGWFIPEPDATAAHHAPAAAPEEPEHVGE